MKSETKPQEWFDSMNRASDSLYQIILQGREESLKHEKWRDSMEKLTSVTETHDSTGWDSEAQQFIVPMAFTVLLIIMIFGLLTLIDSKSAEKNTKKRDYSILDFGKKKPK